MCREPTRRKMESNQQAFWQFSDQLRLHTSNLANLSLNDSIWSGSYASKRPDDRKNFDARVGGGAVNSLTSPGPKVPRLNESWKIGSGSRPVVSGNDFNLAASDGWSKIENANGGGASDFNGFNYGWKMGNPGGDNNDEDSKPLSQARRKSRRRDAPVSSRKFVAVLWWLQVASCTNEWRRKMVNRIGRAWVFEWASFTSCVHCALGHSLGPIRRLWAAWTECKGGSGLRLTYLR